MRCVMINGEALSKIMLSKKAQERRKKKLRERAKKKKKKGPLPPPSGDRVEISSDAAR